MAGAATGVGGRLGRFAVMSALSRTLHTLLTNDYNRGVSKEGVLLPFVAFPELGHAEIVGRQEGEETDKGESAQHEQESLSLRRSSSR